jgi:hypothetical protein
MIQTTVTREQVKDLLRSCHELHAETIQDDSVPVYGLNVFADPGDRHPFMWGQHFEHHAPADITAEMLTDAIAITIPTE